MQQKMENSRLLYYAYRPQEVLYLYRMKKKFEKFRPSELRLTEISKTTNDKEFMYESLKKVSRSFSVVIQQLPEEVREPICLFYLILRGLDTVEDDMALNSEVKKELLLSFSEKINQTPFTLENVGDTVTYRDLMLHFDRILREFQKLDDGYKKVISHYTHEMAVGMDKFCDKEIESYEDWDEYCYYVAGIVGIGLSDLFIESKLENHPNLQNKNLSNEMGLFLQKTNIIRDYAEDLEQDRVFWPNVVWKSKVEKLEDLQKNEAIGLKVINELVINALGHIPSCLTYLKSLSNGQVFRFCAIPQLMAIATLKKVFNNKNVLHENVKIRRGKTARYFLSTQSFEETKNEFISILEEFKKSSPENSAVIENILSDARKI